ncbi:hypothetical protein ElyMa_004813100 [Elysia marginata]|uniref:Nuclear protein MDM1 n=1 Tax=Elysia marginata TaxID=1093978 RepID=A0AAV4IER3_9GAST|nr:hypothetical protein ElyMa_004813100 [Elysia marginata]
MTEPKKKASEFPPSRDTNRYSQPEVYSKLAETRNVMESYPAKCHLPMAKQTRNLHAGDNVESISETYSIRSHSTLTTPDIEDVTRTDTPEGEATSRLSGSSNPSSEVNPRKEMATNSSHLMCPRKAPSQDPPSVEFTKPVVTGKPPLTDSLRNVISAKPPPAPKALRKTANKSPCNKDQFSLETANVATTNSSNIVDTCHQRPRSSAKSVSFNPHHKVISPSLSISSSETNLHPHILHSNAQTNYPDSHASKSYNTDTKTQRDVEKKVRHCKSSAIAQVDLNKKSVIGRSQNIDQNLNKQIDTFPKASMLDGVNAEQPITYGMLNNFSNKRELFKHAYGRPSDKHHNPSHEYTLPDEKETQVNRRHSEEDQIKRNECKAMDCLTSETTEASSETESSAKTRPQEEKEVVEQHDHLGSSSSSERHLSCHEAVASESGPECPKSSITNLAASGSQTPDLPNHTEYSLHPIHYPSSIYDHYYEDEMSFPFTKESRQYRADRRVDWRRKFLGFHPIKEPGQPRALWRPNKSVIVFQPHQTGRMETKVPDPVQVALPKWRSDHQTYSEYDERYFPSQHKLSTSSDLNQEMKRVMKFHNCRAIPKIEPESTQDETQPHLFFNCHGWFPRSTTGAMQAKYRDTLANVKRQWYNKWHDEVTYRNAVNEPRKRRQYESGIRKQAPATPGRRYRLHYPIMVADAKQQASEFSTAEGDSFAVFRDRNVETHYASPSGPAATPQAQKDGHGDDTLSRISQDTKSTLELKRSFSMDSTDYDRQSSTRAAHCIHTTGNSSNPSGADKARLMLRSVMSTENTRRQQGHQNQHSLQEDGMNAHRWQVGNFIQQASLQEAVGQSLLLKCNSEVTPGGEPKSVPKISMSVRKNPSRESLLSFILDPNLESGDEVLEAAPSTVLESKDDVTGPSEKMKNPNRNRGKGASVSWEIKHLDYMLDQTMKHTERTKIW